MKAIFRRKSVSEPTSDPSRSNSKSTSKSATSPPPLPSSTSSHSKQPSNNPKSSDTLPRNFVSTSNQRPEVPNNNSQSRDRSSKSRSTLPQVSLNRFSGAPLAQFNLPSDLKDDRDQTISSIPTTPEAYRTPMSEFPGEIITPLDDSSTSVQSPSSSAVQYQTSSKPNPVKDHSASNDSSSTSTPSAPRRSFDPATHPSKGRPDSLGPNSYFGGIGTPVQHALTQNNSSKNGSQFSELESPQFMPVRVGGVGPTIPSNESKGMTSKPVKSNERSKSSNTTQDQDSQRRSSSKNRKEKEKEVEKEKEKILKRPSLSNLQSSNQRFEKSDLKQEGPLPNVSRKVNPSQDRQSSVQPQPPSHFKSKSQSQSPMNRPNATSYSDKETTSHEGSESKKSSSGFFSMMRRNTNKRKSLIDVKQDRSNAMSKESLPSSTASAGSVRSQAKVKSVHIPMSASTPSLPSTSITASKEPAGQRPPIPQLNNSNGSYKHQTSTPNSTTHHQSQFRPESNLKFMPNAPSQSQGLTQKNPHSPNHNPNSHPPPLDSSVDSTDSSQTNFSSVESGGGRARERSASESRTGSSQGGGPETPLDGTPLIGQNGNGFTSPHHQKRQNPDSIGLEGINSKSKMRNHPSHPPRSTTLDETYTNGNGEVDINEKMRNVVKRTSSQVGDRRQPQSALPNLKPDGFQYHQLQQQHQQQQIPASTLASQPQTTIIKPRTPPNPNPSNPNRPSRQAELEQVRHSAALSKNSSLNEDGEDGERKSGQGMEKEGDAERPSSRFGMAIDAADARNSLDANLQLGETEADSNEIENGNGNGENAPSRNLPQGEKEKMISNPKVTSRSTRTSHEPQVWTETIATSSTLQNNPNDSGHHSWFNFNSNSNLPSSFRSSTNHYRTVQETKRVMVPYKRRVKRISSSEAHSDPNQKQYQIEWREEIKTELVTYCDLFEAIFSRTTEDVLRRLVDGIDPAEIKTLRQTSRSLRFCLDNPKGKEIVLRRFLGPIGYRTWSGGRFDKGTKDPLPLTCNDLDAFMIGADLTPEYHLVGETFAHAPQTLDPRIPLLARASTRAYNKVLSRLRLQPVFRIPSLPQPSNVKQRSPTSSPPVPSSYRSSTGNQLGRVNSYYPHQGQQTPFDPAGSSYHGHSLSPMSPSASMPRLSPKNSYQTISPTRSPISSTGGGASPVSLSPSHSPNGMLQSLPEESNVSKLPPMASPWKPGRSALFRVWVPAREALWLNDEELARAEMELFKSGVWNFLVKGDVIWDSALGPLMPGSNVGKLIFDGRFLRDLSYHYDQIGHLPSWINSFLFSPSYFHNIIHSSGSHPVVYLDILPFREQILSSLRLVQDHLETSSPQGRYRVAKWLYRATVTITGGKIISEEGLESVDEGWHGKIVIETDGTAEKARALISRCAGPTADANARAALLAAVTNGGATESLAKLPKNFNSYDSNGERIETTSPWCILRERSRQGLIWLTPMESLDRSG